MIYDIIIKNGHIIDPSQNINEKGDIYICDDLIVSAPVKKDNLQAKQVIDAGGYYIFPGLIENHAHFYYKGTDPSVPADVVMMPNGVTAAVDQGSGGVSNFEAFYADIISRSVTDLFAYINVSNTGLVTEDYFENINPKFYNKEKLQYMFRNYFEKLLGLKIRLQRESVLDMGLKPLEKIIEIADELGVPVSVHVRDVPFPKSDIAKLLRKGDTWVHVYTTHGESIFKETGEVKDEIVKAKERGVLFDVANGRSGFSFEIANNAIKQGFVPDFISTDLVTYNVYERPLFSLPYTMSIYLNLGLSLEDVVRRVTVNPAKTIADKNIGTLKAGTKADISVFKLKEDKIIFKDRHGGVLAGDKLLIPQMTIKNGRVMYRNIEF